MIQETIKDKQGKEIESVINRDIEDNSVLTINAMNINPCAINKDYVSNIYDECGGVYLVWQNNYGGWSDHLFFKAFERKIKTKSRGEIQRMYSNRATAVESFAGLGFEVAEEWHLINKIPYESLEHRKEIESLFYARQVYLYTGKQHSGDVRFIAVRVKEETKNSFENALKHNDFEVTIELPNFNAIAL